MQSNSPQLKILPSQSNHLLDAQTTADHLKELFERLQHPDGHWHFALDDNTTMNSEFILFHYWLKIEKPELIQRLANHLWAQQDAVHGHWSLYFGGAGNLSTTI